MLTIVSAGTSKIEKPDSASRGSQLSGRAHSPCPQGKASDLGSSLLPPAPWSYPLPVVLLMFPYAHLGDSALPSPCGAQGTGCPSWSLFLNKGGTFGFAFVLVVCNGGLNPIPGRQKACITGNRQGQGAQAFHRLGNHLSSERTSPFISRNNLVCCLHRCSHWGQLLAVAP